MQQTVITDINSDYKEGLSPTELVKGREALNNMILNLLLTNPRTGNHFGDRIYEPTYGCGLEYYLYEPVDTEVALTIKDTIYDSITSWLPEFYITRNSIIVKPDFDNSLYDITIAYIYQGNPYDLLFTAKEKGSITQK